MQHTVYPSHQNSHGGTKGKHPDEGAGLLVIHAARQAGRQASIMFWAVSADCSPLLPVSGLAIVAGAAWMGSEPETMLKTPSVSNKGLECIHRGQNKHLR